MSSPDLSGLIQKYREKGLLVDTNLLLLFFIGDLNPRLIVNAKRIRKYTIGDFELLKDFMESFDSIVTTPNILTEISNLTEFSGKIRTDYFKRFGISIAKFDERFFAAKSFSSEDYFEKFGLTDAAIIHSARNKYLVITDDFPLSNYLQKNDVDVINFTHLKAYNWT
jgi:rRNA-processing protein FCF1